MMHSKDASKMGLYLSPGILSEHALRSLPVIPDRGPASCPTAGHPPGDAAHAGCVALPLYEQRAHKQPFGPDLLN